MLVYTKRVEESGNKINRLYASSTGIPADTDTALVYKEDGTVKTFTPGADGVYHQYFKMTDDYGLIDADTEKELVVTAAGTQIIPKTAVSEPAAQSEDDEEE